MVVTFLGFVTCRQFDDEVPICPHGPMLCWRRRVPSRDAGRTFYSCAAYRDRRHCAYHLGSDEPVTSQRVQRWRQRVADHRAANVPHHLTYSRTQLLMKQPGTVFCRCCSCFMSAGDSHQLHLSHRDHQLLAVDSCASLQPSQLLSPLTGNKCEAQFLFTAATVHQLIQLLQQLSHQLPTAAAAAAPAGHTVSTATLAVAASSVHQQLQQQLHQQQQQQQQHHSFMLDIDHRYEMFYPPDTFATYNLFNHHFFSDSGRQHYTDFVSSHHGGVCVVMDPPFGGRLEAIAATLTVIAEDMGRSLQQTDDNTALMPVLLTLPYFMERDVARLLPGFHMTDLRIDYVNQRKLSSLEAGGRRHAGSAVRLFTNMPAAGVVLAPPLYRHCADCDRWVHVTNRHCAQCRACTSKDGGRYWHCRVCQRCVKHTWRHCRHCQRCSLYNADSGVFRCCHSSDSTPATVPNATTTTAAAAAAHKRKSHGPGRPNKMRSFSKHC